MKSLLKLKHWQFFTLVFAPALVSQFFAVRTITSGEQFSFGVFSAMLLLSAGFLFSWLYAVGAGLHRKLPAAVSKSITRLKIALFIPSAYIALLCADMFAIPIGAAVGFGVPILIVVIPLHLLSMAGIFYSFYFNATSLKAVELQRPVAFADYLGEIFLFWFFPLGIWVIQPRVNAIFSHSQARQVFN